MNYILLHQSYGAKSTRKIAEKMTEPVLRLMKRTSGEWRVYDDLLEQSWVPSSVQSILTDPDNRIINWGNRIFSADNYFDLNMPSGIKVASDKMAARRVMQNAGIPVPKTYFPDTDANLLWIDDCNFPVIVRPRFHYAGKNFHVHNNVLTLSAFLWGKSDWYASEVFNKTHEYRVHTAHGKVLVTHEKPLIEGELRANHAINHEQWRALRWGEFIPEVSLAALRATKAVGLDYAAVDVMYNANTGEVAVAEVNTSPEVTAEYSSGKYAEYFSWVIRNNFPAHFPFEGKSVFYNNILRS